MHPNASLADDVLKPFNAYSVEREVEGQLGLRQDDREGTGVLIPLQLSVEDQGHNDHTFLIFK